VYKDYLESIFKALNSNSLIGVAVVDNSKILLSTSGFEKITNYTEEELKRKNLNELFSDEFIDSINNVFESGSAQSFRHVRLKAKENRPKIVNVFVDTVKSGNKKVKIIHLNDITRETVYNNFTKMLSSINKLIIKNSTKDELFENICNSLIRNDYIDLIWITSIKDNKAELVAYAGNSNHVKYALNALNSSLLSDKEAPIYKSLMNEEIILSNYVPEDKKMQKYKDAFLKEGFLSVCYIPIKENKEYSYAINLYSKTPYFFDYYIMPILNEIQSDIHFALDNIQKLFYKKLFSKAVEATKDWVLATNIDGEIIYANKAVSSISGYSHSELIGQKTSIFKSDKHDTAFFKTLWDTILQGKIFRGVIINKTKNGEYYQLYHTIVPILEKDTVKYFIAMSKDISKEMYLEEQIEKFRYYDGLTNLLNNEGFMVNVENLMEKISDASLLKSVFVIDIYEFAQINKIYGVDVGDRILVEVANRLSKIGKISSRLGDDEFALFVVLKDKNELETTINKIFKQFEKPIKIYSHTINIGINIGIANINDKNNSIRTIITNATNAANTARKMGKNIFRIFNDKLNTEIHNNFKVENLICESLSKKYFTFYLQPIYSSESNRIIEFESLARINHPQDGVLSPYIFIDKLEKSYYLSDFERYLVKHISDYQYKIKEKIGSYIPIGINLSMKNLMTKKTEKILQEVDSELIPYMTLEITERMFSDNIEHAKEILQSLKDMGFRIMIDDFGTGYSSLSYLHMLPIDAIKIDISFVKNMMEIDKVKKIVKHIMNLSKTLNIETVAEGVETKEQKKVLVEFGCDYLQGYLFAKPMPFEEAIELL